MSDANLYGPIITGGLVERGVRDFLVEPRGTFNRSWLDAYLGEIERVEGYDPGSIERPKGVVTSAEFEKWPEDQLPVILVISPGIGPDPIRRGDSAYEATWTVAVAPIVSDQGDVETRRLALAYAAAVRSAMLQHKSLGGFASNLVWRGEGYNDLPFDDARTLGAGRVIFDVTVADVVREQAGPVEPPADPTVDPGPWPDATAVDTTAHPIPITEAVNA